MFYILFVFKNWFLYRSFVLKKLIFLSNIIFFSVFIHNIVMWIGYHRLFWFRLESFFFNIYLFYLIDTLKFFFYSKIFQKGRKILLIFYINNCNTFESVPMHLNVIVFYFLFYNVNSVGMQYSVFIFI